MSVGGSVSIGVWGGGEERCGEMCGVWGSLLRCWRGEERDVWRYGEVRGVWGNVEKGVGKCVGVWER